MRKLLIFPLILLLAMGCQKEEQTARVKSRLKFSMENTGRSAESNRNASNQDANTPTSVVVEVFDVTNNSYSQSQLSLYNFGGTWVSDALELYTGQHQLTQFFVIGENGNVIYATPLEGSDLAQYVNDPLAIDFWVNENDFTMVTPQVLAIEQGDTPQNFGYVGFSFDVVDPNEDSVSLDYIQISFDGTALINPYVVTEGFNEVIVSFLRPSGHYVEKVLSIDGPASAGGNILINELIGDTDESLDQIVFQYRARYESIDGVDNITHIMEVSGQASISLNGAPRKIAVTGNELYVSGNTGTVYSEIYNYYNTSELFDNEGNFSFYIHNDFCQPMVNYCIGENITSAYFMKSIDEYTDSTWQSIDSRDFWIENNPNEYRCYGNSETFSGMCISEDYNSIVGSLYFSGHTASGGSVDCYLVWVAEDTPIDPEYPGASSRLVIKQGNKIPNMDKLIQTVKGKHNL